MIERWIFFPFINILQYYFFDLLGFITISPDKYIFNKTHYSDDDIKFINNVLIPFVENFSKYCNVIIVFNQTR